MDINFYDCCCNFGTHLAFKLHQEIGANADNQGKGFSDARASFQPGILNYKMQNLKKVMRPGVNNGIPRSPYNSGKNVFVTHVHNIKIEMRISQPDL